MKRTSFIAVLIMGFFGFLCTTSFAMSFNPVSDLSGWEEYQWTSNPVTITYTGGRVSFVSDGTNGEAWGKVFTTLPGSTGIMAEVSVSKATGMGDIGIRKYIAKTASGNLLLAQIFLEKSANGYLIYYYLQERDSSMNEIRQLGAGVFGDWGSGTEEWKPGDNVFLGMALVGNEVWFYTPGYDILKKVQILTPFTPSDGEIAIYAWTPAGSANHIEGTVKNVNIIYP